MGMLDSVRQFRGSLFGEYLGGFSLKDSSISFAWN